MNIPNTEVVAAEQKDKGFTLVELLIVIVILGILATVTVFAVRGITQKGQDSACDATSKSYQVAIEAYYANGGVGHPTGAELVAAGLIRDYPADDTASTVDVRVVEGTGTAVTDTSYVAAGPSGNCGTAGTRIG